MVLSWNQRVAKVYVNGIEEGIFSTICLSENNVVMKYKDLFHFGVDFSSYNASGQGGHC